MGLGLAGYVHGVGVALFGVDVDADLAAEHLQLVDGRRAIDVTSHQQRTLAALGLEQVGQLAREGRLARALQARHQDDGRLALEVDVDGRAAHQLRQLVVHYLDHQLARLERREHALAQRFLFDAVGELLGHLVVDVGIEQRLAHVFEGFGHVQLRDPPFAFENLERPFKFFA